MAFRANVERGTKVFDQRALGLWGSPPLKAPPILRLGAWAHTYRRSCGLLRACSGNGARVGLGHYMLAYWTLHIGMLTSWPSASFLSSDLVLLGEVANVYLFWYWELRNSRPRLLERRGACHLLVPSLQPITTDNTLWHQRRRQGGLFAVGRGGIPICKWIGCVIGLEGRDIAEVLAVHLADGDCA